MSDHARAKSRPLCNSKSEYQITRQVRESPIISFFPYGNDSGFFFFFFGLFFCFLGPPLRYTSRFQPTPQPQQCQIWAVSVTYACCNFRSLTHWVRAGIEPASLQISCWVLNLLSHNRNSNLPNFSLFFFFFWPVRATPATYGGSQARGRIGAVAASLRQSHSNAGSEPHLRHTPQLMATPDP